MSLNTNNVVDPDVIDISDTITSNSDRLTADDLLGGPVIVTIASVKKVITVKDSLVIEILGKYRTFKPFKPCLSMRRVLREVWGVAKFKSRKLKLYRDPNVSFEKQKKIGGVRIAEMSHIDRDITIMLPQGRGRRSPYTVRPLKENAPAVATEQDQRLEVATSIEQLKEFFAYNWRILEGDAIHQAVLKKQYEELKAAFE